MKKIMISQLIISVVIFLFRFAAFGYDLLYDTNFDRILKWNTFMGGNDFDRIYGVTTDDNGNIYITGASYSTSWGSPVIPNSGNGDAFIAKLNANGVLQWNTFIGSTSWDHGSGIFVDKNENIYLCGSSDATWGNPVNKHSGKESEAFVAKLNPNGFLKWNTFLGEGLYFAEKLVLDSNGNIYVTGECEGFIGRDVFLAKLDSEGFLKWKTDVGLIFEDFVRGIALDNSGDIYIIGDSLTEWGKPVNPFSGEEYRDAFVAKFNSYGVLLWNTFLGSNNRDYGLDIVIDSKGKALVTGLSYGNWGSPINAYKNIDTFVAKLDSKGKLLWNTFLETDHFDYESGMIGDYEYSGGIAIDKIGNIFVTGYSYNNWTNGDIFVAKLNSNGVRLWKNHMGGTSWDSGTGISVDDRKNIYVCGSSKSNWGNPVNPFIGGYDGFVAKIHDSTDTSTYKIILNRENLYFGSTGNASSSSQTFLISSNSSLSTVPTWSITDNQNWLLCSPTNGIGSGMVNVSVNPSELLVGTYTGVITVSDPDATNSPQQINVYLTVYGTNKSSEPFGEYSTPIDGSTVSSSVPFTGWVLDDIGVSSVKIYNGNTYIGDALLVEGARPDVEEAYPTYPMNYKAGWGYMLLTYFLPNGGNGTYTLRVKAKDTEGHEVTLGSKTIYCDNAHAVKPFGAIDTPAQGGIASGSSFKNMGWALTPPPNKIPTDGSTINVYIDGTKIGRPKYNILRADIQGLFPGYLNKNGAGGTYTFNTTSFKNGVHTIQWIAKDNAGNSDGIGSRFFTIQNTSNNQGIADTTDLPQTTNLEWNHRNKEPYSRVQQISEIPVNNYDPLFFRRGYSENATVETSIPDERNIEHIDIREDERLIVYLNRESIGFENQINLEPDGYGIFTTTGYNGCEYAGYQIIGEHLRTLPIGSTLDPDNGIFYWQPGPGFVGTYRLAFIETNPEGEKTRKNLLVHIEPKYPGE